MEGIYFKDSKIIVKRWVYDEEREEGSYVEKEVESFVPFLNEVFVSLDCTFEQFFNHIMEQQDLYSLVFASQLGHNELKMFDKEWKLPYEHEDDEMERLEVDWYIDYMPSIEDTLTIASSFHGVGDTEVSGFAVEFTPLNKLKNYPLALNTKIDIYEEWDKNKKPKILLETHKVFTVYEVISAILFEITFCGTPEQRQVRIDEINKSAEEVEKAIEEGRLDEVCRPIEDVFKDLEDKANLN